MIAMAGRKKICQNKIDIEKQKNKVEIIIWVTEKAMKTIAKTRIPKTEPIQRKSDT